jgi:hypothetical protein
MVIISCACTSDSQPDNRLSFLRFPVLFFSLYAQIFVLQNRPDCFCFLLNSSAIAINLPIRSFIYKKTHTEFEVLTAITLFWCVTPRLVVTYDYYEGNS